MADDSIWPVQRQLLGQFIRNQRHLAKMSLRDLADRASVSNPYLSQLERGLHDPSLRVLKAIAQAFDLSTDVFLAQAGLLDDQVPRADGASEGATVAAINADTLLSDAQKTALVSVYRSFVEANNP